MDFEFEDRADKRKLRDLGMNMPKEDEGCSSCCNKSSDFWQRNERGEKCIRCLLFIQFCFYVCSSTINILAEKLTEPHTVQQVVIYEIVVGGWFYFSAIYFLWHSLQRSIVLELVSFSIVMVLLAAELLLSFTRLRVIP